MREENKKAGKDRRKDRTELGRKGIREVSNLADKAKEKAEKKLKTRNDG